MPELISYQDDSRRFVLTKLAVRALLTVSFGTICLIAFTVGRAAPPSITRRSATQLSSARQDMGGHGQASLTPAAGPDLFSGSFSGSWGNYTGSSGCQWSLAYSGVMTLSLVQNADGSITGTGTVPTDVKIVVIGIPPNTTCTASPFSTTATGPVSGTNENLSGNFVGGAYKVNFNGKRSGTTIMGSAIFSDTLSSDGTPVPVSSSAAVILNQVSGGQNITLPKTVSYLNQADSNWGGRTYDHRTDGATIAKKGCGLTSLTMAIDYALDMNFKPDLVNDFMNSSKADYGPKGNVGWENATRDIAYGALDFKDLRQSLTPTQDLDNAVLQGFPVIVGVNLKADGKTPGHFVLVTGKENGRYSIADPGHKEMKYLDQTITVTPLGGSPHPLNYNNKFVLRGYVYPINGNLPQPNNSGASLETLDATAASVDKSKLSISIGDEAELLITDPNGKRTGFDPVTRTVLSEIPNSVYFTDALDDDITEAPATDADHLVSISQPLPGTYRVLLSGQKSGTYNLVVKGYAQDGSPQLSTTLTGSTAAGSSSSASFLFPSTPSANPLDDPKFFVGAHYEDFLSRLADQSGLDFWTSEITSCGSNQSCLEVKHINVSAAFYLSIEFQQTGYLVERIYRTSYGNGLGTSKFGAVHQLSVPIVRFNELLPDMRAIGQDVVVNQGNWQQQLETNKQSFTVEFVQRARFTAAFPSTMTMGQFVDKLNANAGNVLSQSERDQLVNSGMTRAQILRAVAENLNLYNTEFNRAFVLMQYCGYLRRNPNDLPDTDYSGYDFWLTKLNQFNGNFVNAEMVKAFIASGEYRQRFGL